MAVSPSDLGSAASDRDIAHPLLADAADRPRRRSPWYVEAVVIVWLLWLYDIINNLAPIRQAAAVANGLGLIRAEATLHLDPERAMDRWLSGHATLGLWSGYYYNNAHFIVTFAVVGWLWWRHRDDYRRLRTTLVVVNIIGFVVFWLYPVAPPRMLPGYHIEDVVAATGAAGAATSLAQHANELASMPSLHLAWACWSALALWQVLRRHHRWAVAVWLYPVVTALDVLATGNHYLLDVVAGVATLAVSVPLAGVAGRLARRIPLPPLAARVMGRV